MHDIEELKRQLKAATDRSRQADEAMRDARKRLESAQLENSGLAGHLVEGPEYSFSSRLHRIIVDQVSGPYLFGKVVKKDGSPGLRTARVLLDNATDLGPAATP